MNASDLQKYCGTGPDRPYLMKPFSVGEFTYATNGHILIRVARLADVPDQTKEANWNGPLLGLGAATFSKCPIRLPEVSEQEACDQCFEGKAHDCPECTCACRVCGGTGMVDGDSAVSTEIRGVPFALRYVCMVAALLGVVLQDNPELEKPLVFKFDGGVGALMPLRCQYSRHVSVEGA